MRTLQTAMVTIAVAMLLVVSVQADEAKPKAEPASKEVAKVLKNQTHCPVMGGKIDSTSFADIQGQRVYFCCPMCEKALREDPDKFFKKAADEGVLFENVQEFCPVSGEKLKNKDVSVDYEGRRVYFCCEGCVGAFDKDPAKYLTKLDGKSEKDTKPQDEPKVKEDHSGHDHH